jgi:hypothetical protein
MKSEFQTMTIKQLKKCVLEHRNDQAAFQALMERVEEQPQRQVYVELSVIKLGLLKKLPTVFGKAFRDFFSPLGARKFHGTVKKFDIFGKHLLRVFPLLIPFNLSPNFTSQGVTFSLLP